MKGKLLIAVILLMTIISAGCAKEEAVDYTKAPVAGDKITATDYADENNWLTLPSSEMDVDVFVLYPTTFSPTDPNQQYAAIDDQTMRDGAREFLADKASCMETVGNIYAPYYRQLSAGWLLTLPVDEQDQYLEGVPVTDVLAAFDYYIKNHNNGRPFVLFSHSQGSTMNKYILFDYLKENPEVAERMVASYVLGYSVTADEMAENSHLQFAENADDTGVIISYNTEAPVTDGNSAVWLDGSLAINPISWTRSDALAPASENLGSYLDEGSGYTKVDHLADARVDTVRGVVICSSVDIDKYSMPEEAAAIFPKGIYHGCDISFYYYNLRQNAENRVANYLSAHP